MDNIALFNIAWGLLRELRNNPKPELFHYTSSDGLLGIVNSKEFWMTKISHLNDRKEFHLTIDAFLELFQKHVNTDTRRKLLGNLQSKFKNLRNHPEFYVLSLSEQRDQLSQWRAYTPSSGGYCLGFKTDNLRKLADENRCTFGRCVYKISKREDLLMELIEPAFELLKNQDNQSEDKVVNDVGFQLTTCVLSLACLIKDQSFEEEKEWRMIQGPMVASKRAPINFHTTRGYLIPHLPFKLSTNNIPLELHSVSIGPTPELEMSKQALETFLKVKGLKNCIVKETKTPYRNW